MTNKEYREVFLLKTGSVIEKISKRDFYSQTYIVTIILIPFLSKALNLGLKHVPCFDFKGEQ